jgi:four helix bundle protein
MGKRFEDLICWQKAIDLDAEVYQLVLNGHINFDQALKYQTLKSAGSIADNIAEGFERGGNKEFIHFLYIAKGSCGELRSQLARAKRRAILSEKEHEIYSEKCRKLSAMIMNFISVLLKSELKGPKYRN